MRVHACGTLQGPLEHSVTRRLVRRLSLHSHAVQRIRAARLRGSHRHSDDDYHARHGVGHPHDAARLRRDGRVRRRRELRLRSECIGQVARRQVCAHVGRLEPRAAAQLPVCGWPGTEQNFQGPQQPRHQCAMVPRRRARGLSRWQGSCGVSVAPNELSATKKRGEGRAREGDDRHAMGATG